MEEYKKFRNILENPSIFNDVEGLKNEIKDCFINFIIEGDININNNEDNIFFYNNNYNYKLFTYNKTTKKLLFSNFIDNDSKNRIIKLFNKINNE